MRSLREPGVLLGSEPGRERGRLNFTLDPGSEIYLPGSVIIDDNDPSVFAGEAPEPATLAFVGGGLALLGLVKRRRR